MHDALDKLKQIDRNIVLLRHAMATLEWDQDTVMPVKAGKERGEQLALLSSIAHSYSVSPEMAEALETLLSEKNLSLEDSALLRFWKKEYKKESSLSDEFVSEYARALNDAHFS